MTIWFAQLISFIQKADEANTIVNIVSNKTVQNSPVKLKHCSDKQCDAEIQLAPETQKRNKWEICWWPAICNMLYILYVFPYVTVYQLSKCKTLVAEMTTSLRLHYLATNSLHYSWPTAEVTAMGFTLFLPL